MSTRRCGLLAAASAEGDPIGHANALVDGLPDLLARQGLLTRG